MACGSWFSIPAPRPCILVRMRVSVLYFAGVRQGIGRSEEAVDLPPGASVGTLWRTLAERHPELLRWEGRLQIAVNEEFARRETPLADGSVVAILPPVSGGAGRARLSAEPLRMDALLAEIAGRGEGARVTFAGTVRPSEDGRPIAGLRYEVYASMAARKLEEVCEEALARFAILDIRIAHREGLVPAGEDAVAIAVSAEHRAAAFDAARYAIERVKEVVPIWKDPGKTGDGSQETE